MNQKVLDENKTSKTTIKVQRDHHTKTMQLEPKKVNTKISKNKSQTSYQIGFAPKTEHSIFKPISYGIYNFFDKGKLILQRLLV